MKQALLCGSLLCCFLLAGAQKKIPEFGKIDPAELRMNSCSFEPDADALKLFDIQEIGFEASSYGTKLTTEKRVRIKILRESGYKHASVTIPYFSFRRYTKIKDLKGIVYSLDSSGKVVTEHLDKKDFFKGKADGNTRYIQFTFPNLREGSVVEYTYTKVERDIIQIDPWIVQDEIPVAYAATRLTLPAFSRIREKIYGADTMAQKTEKIDRANYKATVRTYFREKIPSFRPEPFMSSRKDNLLKVVFLLIPARSIFTDVLTSSDVLWELAGTSILESERFGGQISKTIPGTQHLIDSALTFSSHTDRIHFLFEAVRSRITNVEEQTLYPDDIAEAWKERTGNTAEINLILLNLLAKAGVESYPILISTRENGFIDTRFPSLGQVNGLDVVALDSNVVYTMDASQHFQSFNTPPLNVMNRNGFLVWKGHMSWVAVTDPRPLIRQNLFISARLDEDGVIKGRAELSHYDYVKALIMDTTINEEKDDNFLNESPPGLRIVWDTLESATSDTGPLLQKLDFEFITQQSGDFFFIHPRFLSSKKDNPFTAATRQTDIDLGSNQKLTHQFTIEIPPGYAVEHLPKSISVRASDSSFFYRRNLLVDSMALHYADTFEIRQSYFPREQYEALRQFFERAYTLMNEEIVLKKVNR